ncbi:MAG: Trk system potassium uptake protein TrkA, partial [uncultured Solirubrobacteraceae bacterium]
ARPLRHRRRSRQGRLEPDARADRQGQRGDGHRVRPPSLPGRRAGARAQRAVRRRDGAVGARARRHPARRSGRGGDRRRRGQPADLPGRQGEVPVRADHRSREQPAQSRPLRAAGHRAGRLGDRPDPPADRARGPSLRDDPPARPAAGAPRDHRDGGLRRVLGGGPARLRRHDARRRPDHLAAARRSRLRAQGRHGRPGRRRGAGRPRPGPRGGHHPPVRDAQRAAL